MNTFYLPLAEPRPCKPADLVKPQDINEKVFKLFPAYQPIIEVASGRINSYEALARYIDASGDMKSAGYIFGSQLMPNDDKRLLDRFVREQALLEANSLPDGTLLNINISPQWVSELQSNHAIPTIDMIKRLGVDPAKIVIELTELSGDTERLLSVVKEYRRFGLKIAVDDFGSGFSQLDRVIALEPDIIKLDMKLFKTASNQGGIAENVVESLSWMAIRCGAQIVCEGVETVEEFNFGLKCGARYMQGFLFSQAQQGFTDTETYVDQVSALRENFFAERCAMESAKLHRIQHIKELIYLLKRQLLDSPDQAMKAIGMHPYAANLIRFYICDHDGNQLTPNFNLLPNSIWQQDNNHQGHNWAWRPYFYQLSALIPDDPERLVASSRYQDLTSGAPCKTMATLLDNDRILLVDVHADWE